MLPLVRQLILGEDRVHRTGLDASVAVDALFGVDVELVHVGEARLVFCRMNAVDRADLNAGEVLEVDAWFGDHIGHVALIVPGIQLVPASGTRAIAAASIVSATRSSGSRLWTCDLPQARAIV